MFGGGGQFGGTGGFAGGYGGPGGSFNDMGHNVGGNEAGGGFNAIPGGGGGYGGAPGGGYGGAPVQQSQGLGGYLSGPGPTGAPGEGQPQQGQRDSQSLVPLTLRMLLDADERKKQGNEVGGPDSPLIINGREVSMFTFVATLEAIEMQQVFKVHHVNDGTARIQVKQYNDAAAPQPERELQPGEYVRIFGTLRSWNNDFHVSAHHIGRIEDPNEVSFHFIEVAHIHLSLTGKIKKALPQAKTGAVTQTQGFLPGQSLPGGPSFPPSFGQSPGPTAGMGFGQPGPGGMGGFSTPGMMQHAAPAATAPGPMSFTSPPYGGAAGAGSGGFMQPGANSGGTGFGGGGGAFQGPGMAYPAGGGYGGVGGGMAPGAHGAVHRGY
mmetsp:Transcript_59620/g.104277  ORF Transcript_59620/g.104277 Transcript_59620/m.104277 type:complete len:379 (-) Transcript_59620:117-1253(-)